jgi:hypothetical protein
MFYRQPLFLRTVFFKIEHSERSDVLFAQCTHSFGAESVRLERTPVRWPGLFVEPRVLLDRFDSFWSGTAWTMDVPVVVPQWLRM